MAAERNRAMPDLTCLRIQAREALGRAVAPLHAILRDTPPDTPEYVQLRVDYAAVNHALCALYHIETVRSVIAAAEDQLGPPASEGRTWDQGHVERDRLVSELLLRGDQQPPGAPVP
jgi:hypothetical protein